MRTGKGLKPLILLPALLTLMNSKWTGVRPSTEPLGVIPTLPITFIFRERGGCLFSYCVGDEPVMKDYINHAKQPPPGALGQG
jgi:hypothetical protein